QFDRRLIPTSRIFVLGNAPLWAAHRIVWRPLGFDSSRGSQVESPMHQIHVVAAKIAECPSAVVPEFSPLKRMNAVAVRPLRRRAQPQIPVESGRRGRAGGEPSAVILRRDPDAAFGDLANRSRPDQLNDAAVIFAGVDLSPHLRNELFF